MRATRGRRGGGGEGEEKMERKDEERESNGAGERATTGHEPREFRFDRSCQIREKESALARRWEREREGGRE